MNGRKQRARGLALLGGVNIAIALILVLGAPIHTVDTHWSPHASVHLAQALTWLAGLCVMNLVLVLVPLRRGEVWA